MPVNLVAIGEFTGNLNSPREPTHMAEPAEPTTELPRDPWQRQPGEPAKLFLAFRYYRDLGVTRSLVKVQQYFSGKANAPKNAGGYIVAASKDWDWVERVAAWEDHEYTQDLTRRIELRKAMDQEDLELAHMARQLFRNTITAYLTPNAEGNTPIPKLEHALKAWNDARNATDTAIGQPHVELAAKLEMALELEDEVNQDEAETEEQREMLVALAKEYTVRKAAILKGKRANPV